MSLEINPYIFGKKIGTLLYKNGHVYFEYDELFKASGLEISPLHLPLGSTRLYSNPSDRNYYQGLSGVFHDSLPDKFGTKIIERYFESKNIPAHELNILQKLMFVGNKSMGADCHSTDLKKNYDEKTRSYHTTWSSINVSYEACRGPASKHMEWTKNRELNTSNKGFPLSLKYKAGKWDINTTSHKTALTDKEIEVCAKCHSRHSRLDNDFIPGDKFSNHYLAVLLDEGLYFPDGKIEDEVYIYDSFLQSKMYSKGVTCTDCHNPHTLKRRAPETKSVSNVIKKQSTRRPHTTSIKRGAEEAPA